MKRLLKCKRGEGYIDTVVIASMLVIAFAVKVFPVFIAKNQLNNYENEIIRTCEISGRVGTKVNAKVEELKEQTDINPVISWKANYIH